MNDLHGNLRGLLAVLFWHAQEKILGENNRDKVVLPGIFLNFFSLIENIDESYMRYSVS